MNKAKTALAVSAALVAVLMLLPGAGVRDMDADAPYTPAAQIYYEENRESFESYEGFLRIDGDAIEAVCSGRGAGKI